MSQLLTRNFFQPQELNSLKTSTRSSSTCLFAELPEECILRVLLLVPLNTIGSLLPTCRFLFRVCEDECAWRHLFYRVIGSPISCKWDESKTWKRQCRDYIAAPWDASNCSGKVTIVERRVTQTVDEGNGAVLLNGPCPAVVSFRVGVSRNSGKCWAYVGVMPAADFAPGKYLKGYAGWCLSLANGKLFGPSSGWMGGKVYVDDDAIRDSAVVTMHFDAAAQLLWYKFDGEYKGVAFDDVVGDNLRMFVQFSGATSFLELTTPHECW